MSVDISLPVDAFKYRAMVSDDIIALLALLDIKVIGYHTANKAHILELPTPVPSAFNSELVPAVVYVRVENGDKQWREFIAKLVSCIKANDIARIVKTCDATFEVSERF